MRNLEQQAGREVEIEPGVKAAIAGSFEVAVAGGFHTEFNTARPTDFQSKYDGIPYGSKFRGSLEMPQLLAKYLILNSLKEKIALWHAS